ncbi:MAG: hypothetical protein GX264_01105 [Clostridiales bacterium]|jgi:predicted phosphodiesterase|nr:hypothetical protein [Clostridiales bacterium]
MIYITGDTHGDDRRLSTKRLKKLNEGDTLIICGDFGFIWDGSKKEQKFLNKLGSRKYNICFIDGAHERFDLLNNYPVVQWNKGWARQISGNLMYLMRGQIYELEGKKIFTMGGGETLDIDLRDDSGLWTRAQLPSKEELLEGIENIERVGFEVDLVITHEPPSKVKEFLRLQDSEPIRVSAFNAYLQEFSTLCRYKKWYFGSMHIDKYISGSQTAVFKDIVEAFSGEKI